jgi:predicted dehydrogenase
MNDAFASLGRKLRLGLLGGGPGSMIGPVHRLAAIFDGRYELVAGVLTSSPQRSREAAAALGFAGYGSLQEMLAHEKLDVVAVMTPNHHHFAECRAAMEAGLHVICDKPMTNALSEARSLAALAEAKRLVFCLTHVYSGYPMIRQARAMVAAGALGELRAIQVEYLQAGMSERVEQGEMTPKLRWKLDTRQSGPSLVLGDIGTHAHHLAAYVAGRPVRRLAADLGAVVPGRTVDDYASMLLRFEGDIHGTLFCSQALAGTENQITVRVFGEAGHLEWTHERVNHLKFAPQGKPVQTLARGDDGLLPASARLTRIARGHPEGYFEGFANLYHDAAEAIASRITGQPADPLALDFPTAADGVAGLAFIEAAVASRAAGGGWVDVQA